MESTSKLVNVTRQEDARTYNNAVTHSTSLNSVVDLFFIAGASRNMNPAQICRMLEAAWVEDAELTLRVIFWAGDIRGGAGERRFFRIALAWLESRYPETLEKNLTNVPHFNRWDSLFHLNTDKIFEVISDALAEGNGLCAKWLPRKKQYENFAARLRKHFGISAKQYRQDIVALSKTVETQMCAKQWKEIEYKKVPSVAMNKYRKAFKRNDETRFTQYIDAVTKGDEKINASAIFPHDIYKAWDRGDDARALEAQWGALPNYMEETAERILPVCDVSGSMWGDPIAISVALGLYLSERNTGPFQDAFVTFSECPQMNYLKGTLVQRIEQLRRADWGMNTNLNEVFQLILMRAAQTGCTEEDMPTTVLVISDMEFDACGTFTNYETIKGAYELAGFQLPKLVFWNVNGREGNVPVSAKTKNVALVSGASPAIVKSVLSGQDFTPRGVMIETVGNERYDRVTV